MCGVRPAMSLLEIEILEMTNKTNYLVEIDEIRMKDSDIILG